MSSQGRGRGRGNTLPAWMTHDSVDNRRDEKERGYDDRNRDQQRQGSHRGLGFDERSSRRGDRDISRERGSGRGREDLDFVRGDDFGRDGNIGRDRGGFNSSSSSGVGRGRGRGGAIQPAWMSSGGTDRVGQSTSAQPKDDDGTMEKLLLQAKQLQQEQIKRDDSRRRDTSSQRKSNNANNSRKDDKKQSDSDKLISEEEKFQKQRRFEAEEAAKQAEEERKRLEQLREKEEQRQLRALVGDVSDEEKMKDADNNGASRKNKRDDSEEEDLFEFETEDGKEERLARKRREERKKKLRKLEEAGTHVKEKDEDMNEVSIDQPRNVAGVVQSEMNDTMGHDDMSNANATNMEVVHTDNTTSQNAPTNDNDSGEDSFDIFATDNATPVPTQTSKNAMSRAKNKSDAQECDDAEGYYKANIGEIITLPKERRDDMYGIDYKGDDNTARFRVLGIIGKGVFSSVIKCVEERNSAGERIVAMKIIRNNEVMAKAAAKEMRILKMLCHQRPRKSKKRQSKKEGAENEDVDEEDDKEEQERRERENHNIVRLLDVDPSTLSSTSSSKDNQHHYAIPPPQYRSHSIFLFEFMPFNLREVLSKFGKNVGINLTAVRSYGRQLLVALAHLERHRIVHADLKPDNILVSANFSTVKLADFGSAFFETDHDNDPTPYLVSRFYRPPEVILGLEYDRMVDLWSLSVTLAELFTGSVLFPGSSNNDMLVRFMDCMGPLSYKMVKRHALSYTRMGLQPHFAVGSGGTYQLRKQDVDRVTGQPVCRLLNVLSAKADSRLASVLLRASKGGASERVDVLKFADFLNRCLALDPARRLHVRDALKHDFLQKKKKKDATTNNE